MQTLFSGAAHLPLLSKTFELNTPLGPDALLFHKVVVKEALSELSTFQLDMLSLQEDIDPNDVLAQRVSIRMELPGDAPRYFTGYVTHFAHSGVHGRYYQYQAEVRPWFWFLTRTADCRIFQEKTVPQIIQEVLSESPLADFKLELTGTYRTRGYCVQYRETDFDFLSRLMEEEGIYYYFRHGERNNTLVLSDAMSSHSPYPGYAELPFLPQERAARPEREFIRTWTYRCGVKPGKVVLDDYDHTRPSVDLRASSTIAREHEQADGEIFDYPGTYYARADGEHYAKVRIESLQAGHERIEGKSNARGIAVGHLLTLTTHPRADQNCEHLIVAATHTLKSAEYESVTSESEEGSSYDCNFTAQKSSQPYRTKAKTEKPVVKGPQTGVVVGPAGDEIYTDKYGRVKVQFHWDRYGQHDENSSCWMRVSHPWAGKNWGMVSIPRIGQEVIVDFLEGDPDRPIITGRVYNAEQTTPYDLPGNMTQTGIKTRSSKDGNGGNFNELRFEDKKGEEQLFIHAEKNQDIEVENDETHWVGHDRKKTIDNDETVHVKHDRTETVDNNETITVHGARTETVDKDETITIHSNRIERVDHNETISIGDNRSEDVGQNETVSIGVNQNLSVGSNRSRTVGSNESVSIGSNQSISVGSSQSISIGSTKNETVAMASTEQVGAARTLTVGGAYAITVGAVMNTAVALAQFEEVGLNKSVTVGKNISITAGDSIELVCGKSTLRMDKDGNISINGHQIDLGATGEQFYKADGNITIKAKNILEN